MVTPENIYDTPNPRNPYLMEALRYLDFVQMIGEGTKLMRDSMRKARFAMPEFVQKHIEHNDQVRVTLRNYQEHRALYVDRDVVDIVGSELAEKLDESGRRIVNFIAEYGQINTTQTRDLLGMRDWHSAQNRLQKLVAVGVLKRISRPVLKDPKAHYILAVRQPKNGVGKKG